ncbi:MAG: type II secretion system F family protein [Ignavibacteriales bacterium]
MNGVLLPLILVLAFAVVMLVVQSLSSVVFASRDRTRRVNRRLTLLGQGMEQRQVYEALVRRPVSPKLRSAWATDRFNRIANFIAQSGLEISPMQLIAFTGGAALVIWMLSVLVFKRAGAAVGAPEMLVALIGALILSTLGAYIFVTRRRTKRLKQLENQLPLALDIIIRALKAGHPVISAVGLVTEEMGDPIGSEFGLIVDETTYGAEFREALQSFARRTGSDDAHFFAVSIGIQSDTGGNLAEILANLSNVMRARQTLAKRIKSLSSEGRMSGLILSVLPVFLIGVIGMMQPVFYTSKFGDPIFWPTVGAIMALYLVGLVMMHRITNFKY